MKRGLGALVVYTMHLQFSGGGLKAGPGGEVEQKSPTLGRGLVTRQLAETPGETSREASQLLRAGLAEEA